MAKRQNDIQSRIQEWREGRLSLADEHRRLVSEGVIEQMRSQGRIVGARTKAEIELGYAGKPAVAAQVIIEQDANICPMCQERYFAIRESPTALAKIMCGCNKPLPPDETYRRAYNMARLEGPYRFKQVQPTEARAYGLACCQELLNAKAGWVSLYGDVGSGKTFLATATANEFLLAGKSAIYITFGVFLEEMRRAYDPEYPADAGELFERALNAELLVVDELDRFRATDWAVDRFTALYQTRYNNRKRVATIWVTNAQPVREKIPADSDYLIPLYSRMSESPVVFMSDPDIRPALAAAKKMAGVR